MQKCSIMTAVEAVWQKNIYLWREHKWKYLREEGGGTPGHQEPESQPSGILLRFGSPFQSLRYLANRFFKGEKNSNVACYNNDPETLHIDNYRFPANGWEAYIGCIAEAAKRKSNWVTALCLLGLLLSLPPLAICFSKALKSLDRFQRNSETQISKSSLHLWIVSALCTGNTNLWKFLNVSP